MKFRVWDKPGKTMHYTGFLLAQDGRVCFLDYGHAIYAHQESYEVMFSTGIKDKDGTEIWEGDILAGVYRRQPMLVERHFLAADDDRNSAGQRLGLKVLGNKWQNPELLEKSDG